MLAGRCVMENNPEGGVIWTMLDVTERRQAEEDIRAALQRQTELNALRSRFVAMTSHEFRTPLATILSSAELLRYYSDRMRVSERMETLENIESAVHRMTRMLERVLLIGKSDADMLEFSPGAVDLDALCRTLLGEVTSQQPGAAQRTRYRFEVREPVGLYDENLLRHIFSNLLSNAFKYSPHGQEVCFHVREEGSSVVFDDIDQGIGIPANEVAHLFESFHRASNVGNIPGTGLGLSIVKKSVELHRGTIEVTSRVGDEPGHGTHFVVRL
jgi:signal transduction histidine kinase